MFLHRFLMHEEAKNLGLPTHYKVQTVDMKSLLAELLWKHQFTMQLHFRDFTVILQARLRSYTRGTDQHYCKQFYHSQPQLHIGPPERK